MAGFDRRPLRPELSARPRTVAACPGCSGMALGSSWTVLPRTFSIPPGLHDLSGLSPARSALPAAARARQPGTRHRRCSGPPDGRTRGRSQRRHPHGIPRVTVGPPPLAGDRPPQLMLQFKYWLSYPGRPEQHQVMTARGADLGGTPGHWLSDEVGQVLDHGDLGRRCDRLADHVPLARVADHVESGTDVTAWLEHLHDGISGRLSGT